MFTVHTSWYIPGTCTTVRVLPNTQQPSASMRHTHTRIHHDHTCIVVHTLIGSIHSCKTEESLKLMLLPCCYALQQWLTCGFSMDLLGSSSVESNPVIASRLLNVQSTRHGARPGPKLAPWCTGEPPACPYGRR